MPRSKLQQLLVNCLFGGTEKKEENEKTEGGGEKRELLPILLLHIWMKSLISSRIVFLGGKGYTVFKWVTYRKICSSAILGCWDHAIFYALYEHPKSCCKKAPPGIGIWKPYERISRKNEKSNKFVSGNCKILNNSASLRIYRKSIFYIYNKKMKKLTTQNNKTFRKYRPRARINS